MRLILMLLIWITLMLNNAIAQVQPASKSTPAIRYDLNLRILPDAHRLEVNGSMELPAASGPRAFVQLSLSELMGDLQVEVTRPSTSAGVAKLEKTKVENGETAWSVYPQHPFPSGETIVLGFAYSGGGKPAFLFYIGPEVSFASAYGTNWYPLVIDRSNRGVGSLRISVPAGETVIAEGKKRSSSEREAQGTFLFENNRPDYFSFAAGKYTAVRRKRCNSCFSLLAPGSR